MLPSQLAYPGLPPAGRTFDDGGHSSVPDLSQRPQKYPVNCATDRAVIPFTRQGSQVQALYRPPFPAGVSALFGAGTREPEDSDSRPLKRAVIRLWDALLVVADGSSMSLHPLHCRLFLAALLQCGGVNSAVDVLEIFRQCAQAHDVIIRRGER